MLTCTHTRTPYAFVLTTPKPYREGITRCCTRVLCVISMMARQGSVSMWLSSELGVVYSTSEANQSSGECGHRVL
jgi:hypothetical protein